MADELSRGHGFKAISKNVAKNILPSVKGQGWFFNTELLIRAERKGYMTKEIPGVWKESKDTKVNIFGTVINYLMSILRLRLEL